MGKKHIKIITDSNSGILPSEGKKHNIGIIPMPFTIKNKEYYEFSTLCREQFFERLNHGEKIYTSQPSISNLMNVFENTLKEYEEIIYIPMSSGLSGSYLTAQMLADEYGGRIHVVDNHRISCTQKQSVLEALNLVEEGYSATSVCEILDRHKYDASIYITVDTLEYLKKGGRITKSALLMGDMLNIKPVLQIQGDKLDVYKKVRGKKAARRALIEAVDKDIADRFNNKNVIIKGAYCGDIREAQEWEEQLKEHYPEQVISLDQLPLSICCHIGPSAIAIVCMEKLKENSNIIYEL